MSKGKLTAPNLDDRTWESLVEEAKKLIPRYTPEWTDHNPSDLGITLIELFAWLTDQMIYRLNRVPEKNYIEFLNLIGITRDPPIPAQADITFNLTGDTALAIPGGTQVSTPPSGTEDGIIFETDATFHAVNIKSCIFLSEDNTYRNLSSKLCVEKFQKVTLTVPAGATRWLLMGLALPTDHDLALTFRLTPPSEPDTEVFWRYSGIDPQNPTAPEDWPFATPDPLFLFESSARVNIHIEDPSTWQPYKPADWGATPAENEVAVSEPFYWIGARLSNLDTAPLEIELQRLAGNITAARNVVTVKEELLGVSSGKPFQIFNLKHTPLHQQGVDNQNYLEIAVNEGNGWLNWVRKENFTGENVEEYLCNPVTGEITFGNYPTGNPEKPGQGRIPDEGSRIKAVSYRYVAGESTGNVPAGTIKVQRTPIAGVSGVANEQAARGGTDWEPIEETKRRAPEAIRTHNRAVSAEDYEFLAREASTEVAKVRCFPPKRGVNEPWVTQPFERTPGKVNLIIVPEDEEERQPEPDAELTVTVKSYLDERRTITSILMDPLKPYYVEIKVKATVYAKPAYDPDNVKKEIQDTLYNFLHPVKGAPDGKGWNIGQSLYIPEVFQVINALPAISYVEELTVEGVDHEGNPVSSAGIRLALEDYQLICPAEKNDLNYDITVEQEENELNPGS